MKKSTEVKRFTIKRSRWGKDYLRRPSDSKRCCLGFYAEACGVSTKDTLGKGLPFELEESYKIPAWLTPCVAKELSDMNDSKCTSNFTRYDKEEKIKTIFKKHRVTVDFVD